MDTHRENPSAPANAMALNRLNSLTDGILGFAMTLLVLNVDIPQDHDFPRADC